MALVKRLGILESQQKDTTVKDVVVSTEEFCTDVPVTDMDLFSGQIQTTGMEVSAYGELAEADYHV